MKVANETRRQRGLAYLIVAALLCGCATARFQVFVPAVPPEKVPVSAFDDPQVPIRVQITNFEVQNVDAQFSRKDTQTFREHFSVAIPNMLMDRMAQKHAFARISRSARPDAAAADFIVSGEYDFFQRLGTGGREAIPIYNWFGKINEAWVKATLAIHVIEARTGLEVLRQNYPEEQRVRTTIWRPPQVKYLQPEYLDAIISDVVSTVRSRTTAQSTRPPEHPRAS